MEKNENKMQCIPPSAFSSICILLSVGLINCSSLRQKLSFGITTNNWTVFLILKKIMWRRKLIWTYFLILIHWEFVTDMMLKQVGC